MVIKDLQAQKSLIELPRNEIGNSLRTENLTRSDNVEIRRLICKYNKPHHSLAQQHRYLKHYRIFTYISEKILMSIREDRVLVPAI